MQNFTREELAAYNGKDGKPAYVAFQGKVYDVTESYLWQDGHHQARHEAGGDLTDELEEAPHEAELLDDFPIVGTLS
jgi:predicted heme/steroid binding protein